MHRLFWRARRPAHGLRDRSLGTRHRQRRWPRDGRRRAFVLAVRLRRHALGGRRCPRPLELPHGRGVAVAGLHVDGGAGSGHERQHRRRRGELRRRRHVADRQLREVPPPPSNPRHLGAVRRQLWSRSSRRPRNRRALRSLGGSAEATEHIGIRGRARRCQRRARGCCAHAGGGRSRQERSGPVSAHDASYSGSAHGFADRGKHCPALHDEPPPARFGKLPLGPARTQIARPVVLASTTS
jgi:hypothetical protein